MAEQDNDAMRHKFEQAAMEAYGGNIKKLLARQVVMGCLDEYVEVDVNAAWIMWRACWHDRGQEIAQLKEGLAWFAECVIRERGGTPDPKGWIQKAWEMADARIAERKAEISRVRQQAIEECADRADQFIRDWRICDCGAEEGGNVVMGKYNTECGHSIECDYYLADDTCKAIRALAKEEAPHD